MAVAFPAKGILSATNQILPVHACTFLTDKGFDVRDLYNTAKDVYDGEAVIPLNKRSTKKSKKLAVGTPICEASKKSGFWANLRCFALCQNDYGTDSEQPIKISKKAGFRHEF